MSATTRATISDSTAFDQGARWETDDEVRAYFTPGEQVAMFGAAAVTDEALLSEYAEAVIAHRWHYADHAPGWWADDGNMPVHYPDAPSAEAAATEYAESSEFDLSRGTMWCSISTWRGYTDGGRVEGSDASYKVTLHPPEPPCSAGDHSWEQVNVRGSGGGVCVTYACETCGLRKVTDTWAQDPEDGEQGLESVRYEVAR